MWGLMSLEVGLTYLGQTQTVAGMSIVIPQLHLNRSTEQQNNEPINGTKHYRMINMPVILRVTADECRTTITDLV